MLGLSSFKLVVLPLQLGEVGPYLVWSTWFPSRLPLEGIRPYLDLLCRNQLSMVPKVQDPDSSPRAFHQVGGQGCLLNGR
jgi:hypothetical protein